VGYTKIHSVTSALGFHRPRPVLVHGFPERSLGRIGLTRRRGIGTGTAAS
jgi:hypothetical protein